MNKQLSPPNHPRQLDKDIKIMINNVLFLFPHLGQFSFKLRNDVPKLLKKYYPNHKLYVVYKSSKRLTSLNKYKDCFPTLLSSNVIYKYSRSGCNISEYIIAVSTWVMAKLVIPSQSSTWEHIKQTGHSASLDDFSIIDLSLNRGGCRRRMQTQDAEATFSPTGLLSTHYLCSGKANPKIEIPTTIHANPEKLFAGRKKLLGGA